MRFALVGLLGLSGAVILGVAVWSSWPIEPAQTSVPKSALHPVKTDDIDGFVAEIRNVARDYMAGSPELRDSLLKFAAALGSDAVNVQLAEQRREAAEQMSHTRDEEEILRRRVDLLTVEAARLERIARAQRQIVADIMNEWTTMQARTSRYADVKDFSLSIIANWISGPLLLLGAWLLGRRPRPLDVGIRPLRRS